MHNSGSKAVLPGAEQFVPDSRSLERLRSAVDGCRGCDLYADATQAVFGEGAEAAEVMLVGEQPGDKEDLEGEPFVGPAGRLLDRALEEAGIDRGSAYVTNAVKHFKWKPRGKRRIHDKPRAGEITACLPWLEAELEAVKPRAVVALGATASRALFGTKVKVMADRGTLLESDRAEIAAVTIHPSAVLRARSSEDREAAMAGLVSDLGLIAEALA